MNDEQANPNNLIDTTDCLEAMGVFKGWKNTLFVIIILCLLLLQGSFWLVNTGYVKAGDKAKCEKAATIVKEVEKVGESAKQPAGPKDKIEEAAKKVAAEAKQPSEAAPQEPQKQRPSAVFEIKFKHVAGLIRVVNFVLILTVTLYCLTLLFSLKISLVGRLGGINHISRAFFLSLVVLVVLLPWQLFFSPVVAGAMYTPSELSNACIAVKGGDMLDVVSHYLRFSGYWLVVLLLLILSQTRSSRWARAILRRLEVI